jgi:hypothetical protein
MAPHSPARVRATAALAFVLLPALCGGCQALKTHALSDSYYEQSGVWFGHYDIDPGRARVAVLAALADLRMPAYQEGQLRRGGFIDTRTPEGLEARVLITPLVPYGEGTRVGVRVGGFGTHPEACAGILDEIARHLDAVRRIPPAPTGGEGMRAPGAGGSPPTTAAPPGGPVSAPALPPQPIPVQ